MCGHYYYITIIASRGPCRDGIATVFGFKIEFSRFAARIASLVNSIAKTRENNIVLPGRGVNFSRVKDQTTVIKTR